MATTNPQLASEWHPTLNGNLTPQDVVAGTMKRVWWICHEGHQWRTAASARLSGTGCPTCAKYGFDPGKPAVVYFLAHSQLHARKIGITNVGTKRLVVFARQGWRVVSTSEFSIGLDARRVEVAILDWIRNDLGLSRHLSAEDMGAGWTESFSEDGPTNQQVVERIHREAAKIAG